MNLHKFPKFIAISLALNCIENGLFRRYDATDRHTKQQTDKSKS